MVFEPRSYEENTRVLKYKKFRPTAQIPDLNQKERIYVLRTDLQRVFFGNERGTIHLGLQVFVPEMFAGLILPIRNVGLEAMPQIVTGHEELRISVKNVSGGELVSYPCDPIATMTLIRTQTLPLIEGI